MPETLFFVNYGLSHFVVPFVEAKGKSVRLGVCLAEAKGKSVHLGVCLAEARGKSVRLDVCLAEAKGKSVLYGRSLTKAIPDLHNLQG